MEKTLELKIKKWITEIFEECSDVQEFEDYLFSRDDVVDVPILREEIEWKFDEKYCIDWGYSKVVIAVNDDFLGKNYVIKLPRYVEPEKQVNFNLRTACDMEVGFYEAAQLHGLGDWFAGCWRIDVPFRGIVVPCYVMERADTFKAREFMVNSCSEWYSGDSDEVADLFLEYWEDYSKMEDFVEFLTDYEINDIHEDNVGIIDSRLVCIDYSGYRGDGEYAWRD